LPDHVLGGNAFLSIPGQGRQLGVKFQGNPEALCAWDGFELCAQGQGLRVIALQPLGENIFLERSDGLINVTGMA